jgi:hypothetical protein
MEREGLFDTGDRKQVLLLHFIFQPRIQQSIDVFVASWNSHPVRTERSRTPEQIFIDGALQNGVCGQEPGMVDDYYGVDQDEYPGAGEIESVELTDVLSDYPDELLLLRENLDPMSEDSNNGVDIFLQGKQLLGY